MHIVFYQAPGKVGNVNCKFLCDPPRIEDIRNLEDDISTRFCNGDPATVTGWAPIRDTDDTDLSSFRNCISITVNGQELCPGSKIEFIGEKLAYANVIWTVEMGKYVYHTETHVGWYLFRDEDRTKSIPLGYLIDQYKGMWNIVE